MCFCIYSNLCTVREYSLIMSVIKVNRGRTFSKLKIIKSRLHSSVFVDNIKLYLYYRILYMFHVRGFFFIAHVLWCNNNMEILGLNTRMGNIYTKIKHCNWCIHEIHNICMQNTRETRGTIVYNVHFGT
jgi:hypothetical protein